MLSSECSSLKRLSWLDLRLLEEAYGSPQPPLQENRFNGEKKKTAADLGTQLFSLILLLLFILF